jgi:hypothetical protein
VRQITGVQQQENRAPSEGVHPDIRLADLAARQHGVVSRVQLGAIGLSGSAIRHRVAVKRLHRIHTSVYAVGFPLLPRARYMAAVLACGEGAVLSHNSAAAHHELRSHSYRPVDVTVIRAGGRRRPGIGLHVTGSLPDDQVDRKEGIPCTSPMRTLVDLAAVVRHPSELKRALEASLARRLFDRNSLDAILERSNGRRGIKVLCDLLADLPEEAPPVTSELERRALELIVSAGVPYPVINGQIDDLQVDFHWPEEKVVVETDGAATHGHLIAFHRDRGRDLKLALADWHVIRLTWSQVVDTPEDVVAALRRLLRRR